MSSENYSLRSIHDLARNYADARELLRERVQALDDALETEQRRKLPGIKASLSDVAQAHQTLATALTLNAPEFASPKPRTIVAHGYKLGFQKGKGKITMPKPAKVLKLIKKFLADKAAVLIRSKEEVDKNALKTLTVAELVKIGVTIRDAGDEVVIKPVVDDLDKLLKRLLEKAEDNAQDEAEERS